MNKIYIAFLPIFLAASSLMASHTAMADMQKDDLTKSLKEP
ncbi:hypothetical protein JOE11_005529 [Robbsia andropogonis]